MTKIKKAISLGLVLVFLVAPLTVLAQTSSLEDLINQKKGELKELQQEIDNQTRLLEEKRKEKLSLANQLTILESQIKTTELELQRITARSQELKLEHNLLNRKLVDAEEEILAKKLVLREVLQVSYEQKRLGTLEILLTATTFSEFMTRLEYINTVGEKVTALISKLSELLTALKERKDEVEQITEELANLKSQKELEQGSLTTQQASKANLLNITKNQEAEYAARLEASRQEYLAASAEITRLITGKTRVPTGPKTLVWPISSRTITAGFLDPDYERIFGIPHTGMDIATPQGTPVRAPADGIVTKIQDGGARGLSYMIVEHDSGLTTVYMHLSGFAVGVGTYVVQGQVIAYSGGTPGTPGAGYLTTGPHLHLEVWDEGQRRNPLNYLT